MRMSARGRFGVLGMPVPSRFGEVWISARTKYGKSSQKELQQNGTRTVYGQPGTVEKAAVDEAVVQYEIQQHFPEITENGSDQKKITIDLDNCFFHMKKCAEKSNFYTWE